MDLTNREALELVLRRQAKERQRDRAEFEAIREGFEPTKRIETKIEDLYDSMEENQDTTEGFFRLIIAQNVRIFEAIGANEELQRTIDALTERLKVADVNLDASAPDAPST